ncbi:MAG: serine hydrolase [Legionella sp.]|nr:serine hydrolase [Legionella sp.]
MSDAAEKLIRALQNATGKASFPMKFWESYLENTPHTFQDALNQYAEYYAALNPAQQKAMSLIFWEQIEAIGTPVIEDIEDINNIENNCAVYFLFPKSKMHAGSDLYLQGDFHGYDTTDDRSRIGEFENTGIMLHQDTMPRDAVLTYRYIQLDKSLRNKTPTEHHGSEIVETPPTVFFPETTQEKPDIIPPQTEDANDKFWPGNSRLLDEYSTHRAPFIGSSETIFCVNANPERAHLSAEVVHWPSLLSSENPENSDKSEKKFMYHDRLYSDLNGDLQHVDAPITENEASEHSEFTRAIYVFKPTSGKIDKLVFVNDGVPYLLTGAMTSFENMAEQGKLSPNTAFVFVTQLPGLLKTIDADDPKANMPGMGARTIDYEHGIDQYADFIKNKLLPGLETKDFILPKDPNNRRMIGSSMSGTAGIYIASKYPDLFGTVVAQSPSPSNRSILKPIIKNYDASAPRSNILMSAGLFEQLGYAENTNLFYARELSKKLNIPLEEKPHGHQFVAWVEELEHLDIRERMLKADIPGVSIAYLDTDKTITPVVIGETPKQADTVFGAASLSKPVFSYLVLKLIADKKVSFDLDAPISDILAIDDFYQGFLNQTVTPDFIETAKEITPRMVLSHTTGIPIDGSPRFDFEPGTAYAYGGVPLVYLQKAIEKQMGLSLDKIADNEVFKPLGMKNTRFVTPAIAANSLHTTASDYARFAKAWMNSKNPILQEAFKPAVSLTKDQWAQDMGVAEGDLQHLAWGLGLGLQLDDDKNAVTAFHSGDMNQWRGWVAMDLSNQSAVVYFANGSNGHVLADVIVSPEVELKHGRDWFFKKFGFASNVEPGFEQNEKANMALIGDYLKRPRPEVIESNKTQHYKDAVSALKPAPEPPSSHKPKT